VRKKSEQKTSHDEYEPSELEQAHDTEFHAKVKFTRNSHS